MEIQKKAREMFENKEIETLNEKELKEIKRILGIMRKDLSKYDDKYMKKEDEYMIYDLGEYRIDEDRWWVFEYEIEEYEEKVNEILELMCRTIL